MVKTYSASEMIITANGKQVTGFSDGDLVTISLDEDKFAKYKSVDGPVSRSHNVSNSGMFKFSLAQTSVANQIFSAALNLDDLSPSGKVPLAIFISDPLSNGTFFTALKCWVKGMPEAAFAKEIGTYEWEVDASYIAFNIAGADDLF